MYYTINGWALQQNSVVNNQPSCVWSLQNLGQVEYILVGQPFFTQFYVAFDADNSNLGFGIVVDSTWPE
jgi:signal transduction protein with GAF and PtsI domain